MITPQKPKNEIERLQALHNLHILDTRSEERFDSIVRVAKKLFHVPIVSVSFVDKEREWFKSKFGLYLEETPREISFGAHVILQEEIMIVQDAQSDVRFRDNPLVIGKPDIRYYLGCPVTVQGQFNVGTLCLIDHKPQQFDAFDLNTIKDLASTITTEFDEKQLFDVDELTKLYNRHGFIFAGNQIIKRCNQYDKGAILIYFDLTRLKSINDNYGYGEGDHILKIFSQQLFENFRQTDAIARLGGDKFCVLCSGMFKEHLPNLMKRFQKKLSLLQADNQIEYNMGIVQYDRCKHRSIYSLIEEVYEKIYEYKRHTH